MTDNKDRVAVGSEWNLEGREVKVVGVLADQGDILVIYRSIDGRTYYRPESHQEFLNYATPIKTLVDWARELFERRPESKVVAKAMLTMVGATKVPELTEDQQRRFKAALEAWEGGASDL